MRRFVVSVLSAFVFVSSASAQLIGIAGDSTVADFDTSLPYRGWGQLLPEYLLPPADVSNHAFSGRSSKSFITEGRWANLLADNPDFILIQFGHNDENVDDEHRYTDPATTFRTYIGQMIDEARAIGAVPVLVTPVARMNFQAEHEIYDRLRPYADAMVAVGAEKSVFVIDLNASSIAYYESIGQTAAQALRTGVPGDITHFGEYGARQIAGLVAADLGQVPGLEAVVIPEPSALALLAGLPLALRRRHRRPQR